MKTFIALAFFITGLVLFIIAAFVTQGSADLALTPLGLAAVTAGLIVERLPNAG